MNGISLRQLECFLEVCRDFHFSNAARRLGMAQPPLSRQIRELENRIGSSLFDRSKKSVSLTATGAALLKEVYAVPGILRRAVTAAQRAARGESELLRIGFVGAILGDDLLDLFQRFRKEHPDTQLSLVDFGPAELLAKVERGDLDGAFLGVEPQCLPEAVRRVAWKREPLYACLPLGHALEGRKSVALADLQDDVFVSLSAEVAPAYRAFLDTLFSGKGLRPPTTHETNGAQAMLGLVVAGCGVALLPRSAIAAAGDRVWSARLAGAKAVIEEVFVCSAESNVPLEHFLTLLGQGGR